MNMLVLDSHLEALVFNYLSFGLSAVVNNLWAWIAVITAAVSFWRIRAAGCTKHEDEEPSFKDRSSKGSQLLVPEVSYQSNDVADDKPSSSQAIAPAVNIDGGMIKGKFALYFYDDEDEREGDGGELTPLTEEWEEDSNHLGGSNCCESETEWWEKMLRLRSGDKELYKYQDLTKLNGNVVRLWDWDM